MNRIFAGVVVWSISALFGNVAGHAADYPTRPVRIIVPFPPGGTTDIIGRVIGDKLAGSLGQQMVIDNRSGAGGVIGTNLTANANPDGYTMALIFVSHAINPHVYVKLPYDTERDLAPVGMVAVSPNVVVVTPSLPVKSVKDLIEYAKARPGKVNFASAGVGTNSHLSGEMLKSMAGIQMLHVPYKGGPPANADVAAGAAHVTIPSMPLTMPLINAGRLRAIAVTSAKRSPVLPDVPTVAETLPGYESYAWYGFVVPTGTPAAIITRLSSELEKIVRMPDVIKSLSQQGAEPTYMDPKQFGEYIRSETKRWGDVVKAAGLKPGEL